MTCSPPQTRQRRRVQIIDLIEKVNNFYIMKSIRVGSFVGTTDLWYIPWPPYGLMGHPLLYCRVSKNENLWFKLHVHGNRVIHLPTLVSFIHVIQCSPLYFFHWGDFFIFKNLYLLIVHIEWMSAYKLKIHLPILIFCRFFHKMLATRIILPA